MKKFTLIFFLIINYFNVFSQEKNIEFYNSNELYSFKKELKSTIKEKNKSFKKTSYSKDKKKATKKIVTYFNYALEDSLYFHHKYFNEKIQSVLQNIYKYNPKIKENQAKFLINRNFTPNAASYGVNIFEVNLGLFTLTENDDELAFILCHEIAHEKLNHLEKGIENKKEVLTSDVLKDKTNAILKTNGSKSSRAYAIIKETEYNLSKKSIQYEVEADSLGFIYFNKTNYDPQAAASVLQKMGTLEERLFSHKINWKETFGSDYNGYINKSTLFKKRVIEEDFKFLEDSLRTHPDIDQRLKNLNFDPITLDQNKINKEQVLAFLSIACLSRDVVKPFYIYCLLHEKFPENKTYTNKLIELIDLVYTRKKNHVLGKYVPAHINNYSKEKIYNDIIYFLHNSELKELKEIKTFLNQKL